jgi:NifU-like protein involved in Fe-S cluster formation
MIRQVTFAKTTFNDLPYKFEAGTPHIAGVIGLGAAIDYVSAVGLGAIATHEQELLAYATEQARAVRGPRLIGTASNKASVLSFVVDGVHPHDVGTILDDEGIAVRAGHHCAMPVMEHFHIPATVRASFALYNTRAEGFNPLCGDKVTLHLKLVDSVIEDVRFEGNGCAISTASASLMTEALKGKTLDEVQALFGAVHALLTAGELPLLRVEGIAHSRRRACPKAVGDDASRDPEARLLSERTEVVCHRVAPAAGRSSPCRFLKLPD